MLGGLGPGLSLHRSPKGGTDAPCTWTGRGQEGWACLKPLVRLPGSPGMELKHGDGNADLELHLLMPALCQAPEALLVASELTCTSRVWALCVIFLGFLKGP